jgi:hypothetical protein
MMSFRAARLARHVVRPCHWTSHDGVNQCVQVANGRMYSSAGASKKSSNVPFYLMGLGFAGLGAYIYLDKTTAQTKSPLDPENFVDFKLKNVEKYNHNTSKLVCFHSDHVRE